VNAYARAFRGAAANGLDRLGNPIPDRIDISYPRVIPR
jgi:hypothetical protein